MPQYKLTYFDLMGRAEITRWIFAYGGIAYQDDRLTREEFAKIKSTIKGGKLPVLTVDDKPLPQSLAIARYAARKAGIVPQDDLEAAFVDALAETLHEMIFGLYSLRKETPDYEKLVKKVKEDFFPNHIEPVVKSLDDRFKDKEWFITGKLTWGDLMIGRAFAEMSNRQPELFKKYTHLLNHVQKVCDLPAIKKWIETRPETKF